MQMLKLYDLQYSYRVITGANDHFVSIVVHSKVKRFHK
jgi:hypothetical protein